MPGTTAAPVSWLAVGKRWNLVFLVAAVLVVAGVVVAVAGFGGGGGPASKEDYEASVVNTRDRVDFALGRIAQAQSKEELLERMDEAASLIDDAAGSLADVNPPTEFEDETERLVRQLRQLSTDIQGTADQARVPGFDYILTGAAGLNFDSWDRVNAILAELAEQGIDVQPIGRH